MTSMIRAALSLILCLVQTVACSAAEQRTYSFILPGNGRTRSSIDMYISDVSPEGKLLIRTHGTGDYDLFNGISWRGSAGMTIEKGQPPRLTESRLRIDDLKKNPLIRFELEAQKKSQFRHVIRDSRGFSADRRLINAAGTVTDTNTLFIVLESLLNAHPDFTGASLFFISREPALYRMIIRPYDGGKNGQSIYQLEFHPEPAGTQPAPAMIDRGFIEVSSSEGSHIVRYEGPEAGPGSTRVNAVLTKRRLSQAQ